MKWPNIALLRAALSPNALTAFAINKSLKAGMLVCLALVAGCSDGTNDGSAFNDPEAATPFQELYDQGIDRYLGKYSPMLAETEGDVVTYTFGAGDGPLCINGAQYRMATRDQGSSELMIFLRGGGFCTTASCGVIFPDGERGIPKLGVLDTARPGNPVAAWSTVYVPYCDGGLNMSDRDSDSNGDGQIDRYQRGLHNLSAALDVAAATFPSPSHILLAGGSAGGFGVSFALPLVRKLYPNVSIEVINDSGVGVLKQGDPQAFESSLKEWNAEAFFPASCTSCIGTDGHITDYYKWGLGQDPNFRLGMMSFKKDRFIAMIYGWDIAAFEQAMMAELADLERAYPERVHSFLPNGTDHVILIDGLDSKNALDVTAGGVSALTWVTAMLNGSSEWVSTNGDLGTDTDGDGTRNELDADDDNDGVNDELDICPVNAGQDGYGGCPVPDPDACPCVAKYPGGWTGLVNDLAAIPTPLAPLTPDWGSCSSETLYYSAFRPPNESQLPPYGLYVYDPLIPADWDRFSRRGPCYAYAESASGVVYGVLEDQADVQNCMAAAGQLYALDPLQICP